MLLLLRQVAQAIRHAARLVELAELHERLDEIGRDLVPGRLRAGERLGRPSLRLLWRTATGGEQRATPLVHRPHHALR
jgi:hypothetical protein